MELWSILIIIGVLALTAVLLLVYLFSLRSALKEVARELDDKLKTDTNTLISISSGDRTIRDLAAQMNKQLQALRKERLKLHLGDTELKTAVTNISHDLRTPLTAICGYLNLMEQEELPEKAKAFLAVVCERTDAMCALTEELFHYSVITSAADTLCLEPVNLGNVLEQSLAGCYSTLSARGIVPRIEMSREPVLRMLDKNALRRIFDNILSNAAKYSDGDLNVRLLSDGKISFENNAKELDSVQTARLFDRFFTVNTASGGTGLGLSIAKLLTEKMDGIITAMYTKGRLHVCVDFPEISKTQNPCDR